MNDIYEAERPSAAELQEARAGILAFREQHKTLGTAALAIAFIEQRGSATSAELSVLLGLGQDEYPSVVLRSSVQGERLAVSGRTWTLGPKAIPGTRGLADLTTSDVQGLPQQLVGELSRPAQKLAGQTKPELVVPTFAPTAAPTMTPTMTPTRAPTAAPSRCRFAVWSDGQVEIAVKGMPSVMLSLDEIDDLVRFLEKMAGRA